VCRGENRARREVASGWPGAERVLDTSQLAQGQTPVQQPLPRRGLQPWLFRGEGILGGLFGCFFFAFSSNNGGDDDAE
jgi:hypothetical protein